MSNFPAKQRVTQYFIQMIIDILVDENEKITFTEEISPHGQKYVSRLEVDDEQLTSTSSNQV